MFNRRRLSLVVAGACLLLASGASAAVPGTFTATSTPSHVKPETSPDYEITLTNDPSSDPKGADRATIGIPGGFENVGLTSDPPSVTGCAGTPTWNSEVAPDGKTITLARTGNPEDNNLCPGGTLEIVFSAKSPETEGSYSWSTEMFHGEEKFDPSGAPPTVQVDGTAPTVTITGPSNPSNDETPTFTFSANEQAQLACTLDGVPVVPCTSPQTLSDVPDGQRTFTVVATDPAGNSGQNSYGWTIDTVLPTIAITEKPSNPSNSNSATLTFTASETASLACKLDGAAAAPCTSPATYTGLGDGSHTFTVQAIDAAGNAAEAGYSWTIETRAPTAAVGSGPAALSNSRSATFAFSADELASFECQLDGGSFQACSSPASYQGLGDGAHMFAVRPTDAVGNPGATASYPWRIDATAPQTTLGSAPRSRTTTISATFRFSASESAVFQCRLDAGTFGACASPKTYAALRRSGHSFEVRAIDAAGNFDATPAVHRWTVTAVPRAARTASALLAPRAGARVTSPPILVWRRTARASYYNVQLYRGSVKVLSSWPTRTRLQLRTQWTYVGRQRRLAAGTYRWYVWPGYGRPSVRRYGRLLGQSSFTVTAPARR